MLKRRKGFISLFGSSRVRFGISSRSFIKYSTTQVDIGFLKYAGWHLYQKEFVTFPLEHTASNTTASNISANRPQTHLILFSYSNSFTIIFSWVILVDLEIFLVEKKGKVVMKVVCSENIVKIFFLGESNTEMFNRNIYIFTYIYTYLMECIHIIKIFIKNM